MNPCFHGSLVSLFVVSPSGISLLILDAVSAPGRECQSRGTAPRMVGAALLQPSGIAFPLLVRVLQRSAEQPSQVVRKTTSDTRPSMEAQVESNRLAFFFTAWEARWARGGKGSSPSRRCALCASFWAIRPCAPTAPRLLRAAASLWCFFVSPSAPLVASSGAIVAFSDNWL